MGTGGTMHSLQIGDSPRSVPQRLPIYEALGPVTGMLETWSLQLIAVDAGERHLSEIPTSLAER